MPTKNPRYQVMLRKSDAKILEKMAEIKNKSVSGLINDIVAEYLDKDDDAYWIQISQENEKLSESKPDVSFDVLMKELGLK